MKLECDLLVEYGAVRKCYQKGDVIFQEGDLPRWFFQILSGEVRLYNMNLEGKEFTQGLFYEGCSFGEPPLFIGENYPASAIALKDSELLKLPAGKLHELLNDNPKLQMLFLLEFAQRIYNKTKTAREIINNPPEIRILGFLNSLRLKDGIKEKVQIPFTRQEIANHTGLRVETVIRTLKRMQDQNKVEIINRKLFY